MTEQDPRLSFVQATTSTADCPINYWSVQETGVWAEDNALGRSLAEEYIDYLHKGGPVLTLAYIVKAMREQPRHAGIEVGFWTKVAEHLSQAA